MYCPNCKQEFDGKFCPECGTQLIDAPQSAGISINLGDANAISGGINIDSHNVTNIVHERQKHKEEIHLDKVREYKALCEVVYADGVMTCEESRQLENLRLSLGLDSVEADSIRENVRQLRLRQSQNLLNPMMRITLQQIVGMARNGKIDMLKQNFSRLEVMAEKYDAEEVQFYYYLILSGLNPNKCVKLYESRTSDNYWQAFWTYVAYQNVGELSKAQTIMAEMESWTNQPYGNMALLATADSLYAYWNDMSMTDFIDQARMFLEHGADGFSEMLERFAQTLMLLVEDNDENLHNYETDFLFYFNYVLSGLTHKRKMAHVYNVIPKMPKISPLPR